MMKQIAVKYIGRHDTYTDKIFKTKLTWANGESHLVDAPIAKRMLEYADCFAIGTKSTTTKKLSIEKPVDESARNLDEETRFQLRQMTSKKAITDFIEIQWGIKTDTKNRTVKELREEAIMHLDNFGHIGND